MRAAVSLWVLARTAARTMASALRMARFTDPPVEDEEEDVFLVRLVDLRGVFVVVVLLVVVRFLLVRLVFFVAIMEFV